MLKILHIQNLVLIEDAKIFFKEGFNVLSGETGAGKSAIIEALSLVLGAKTDVNLIRRGMEKGAVEAVFDVDSIPVIKEILQRAGIEHEQGEELIIRREISSQGKSRAFLNNQMAQISLLKTLSEHLIEMVGQHANQKLLEIEHHRSILDLFGNMEKKVSYFTKSWSEEISLKDKLEQLLSEENERKRQAALFRSELEELEAAQLREGEDEELFSEYTLLSNAEELIQKARGISETLQNERQGALILLKRQRASFEQISSLDKTLQEASQSYEGALLELQEVAYTLEQYANRMEYNPERIKFLDERLLLLNKLKKKYGPTLLEVLRYHEKLSSKLSDLENTEGLIESLQEKIQQLEKKNRELSDELTLLRKAAGSSLEKAVKKELKDLNMAKADFLVEISPQKTQSKGSDRIEFFLAPNVGERPVSVRESASGGELSRLLLALQTLLSGRAHIPTIVFDEIDANIGGETATVIGKKLQEIGKRHQVLCITHFPQVAKQAEHHLQISKHEREGRTFSEVTPLDEKTREKELLRMLGSSLLPKS